MGNQYKSGVKATEAVRNINSGQAQETVNNLWHSGGSRRFGAYGILFTVK